LQHIRLNGRFGLQQVSAIVESSGNFKVEAEPDDKNAPTGHYRVLISPISAPTDQDRRRINAERIFFEAERLRKDRLAASTPNAIQKYSEGLSRFIMKGQFG
jgi:hypothetical protein